MLHCNISFHFLISSFHDQHSLAGAWFFGGELVGSRSTQSLDVDGSIWIFKLWIDKLVMAICGGVHWLTLIALLQFMLFKRFKFTNLSF